MFFRRKLRGTNREPALNNGYGATLKKIFLREGLILLFFAVVLPLQSFLWALEEKSLCKIEYINEKLTVNVDNIELGKVLTLIQKKTGITFVLRQEQSEQIVSFLFESIPLSQSLKRILGKYNHAIIFNVDKLPIKVIVYGNAFFNSPNQLGGNGDASAEKKMISSFSAQNAFREQNTEESSEISSTSQRADNNQSARQNSISTKSPKPSVTQPLSSEQMTITTASEIMEIQPTSLSLEQMIIPTASEVMEIKSASLSLEQMIIPTASETMNIKRTALSDKITIPQLKE
jgi:hypothetical protein